MADRRDKRRLRDPRRCGKCGKIVWEDGVRRGERCPSCGGTVLLRVEDPGIAKLVTLSAKHTRAAEGAPWFSCLFDVRTPGWTRTVAFPAVLCLVVLSALALGARSGAELVRPETDARTECGHCGELFAPTFELFAVQCPQCSRARTVRLASCPHCPARILCSDVMDVQIRAEEDLKPFRAFCPGCLSLFALPAGSDDNTP
jgi:DNA-directed RNA polymerase subunit RPC12/RpoP